MRTPYETLPDYPPEGADEQQDPRVAAETEKQDRQAELLAIVGWLSREADKRVGERLPIEERWMRNLYQYHGLYTEEERKAFDKSGAISRVFVNETRPKTNTMSARLSDLLFPTDDKNWGIQPTPVPQLSVAASDAMKKLEEMRAQADAAMAQAAQQGEEAPTPPPELNVFEKQAQQLHGQIELTRKAAENMAEVMDDQLKQSNYAAQCRVMLDDACKLGTGIMKGPILDEDGAMGWKFDPQLQRYALAKVRDVKMSTSFQRVDPWAFFPTLTRPDVSSSDGVFERHLYTEGDLRRLARQPGFERDTIRMLLKSKSLNQAPAYLADLRQISAATFSATDRVFIVWEYHGPLSGDQLQAVARGLNRPEILMDASEITEDVRYQPPEPMAPGMPMMAGGEAEDMDENAGVTQDNMHFPQEVVGIDIDAGIEDDYEEHFNVDDFEVDPLAEVQCVVWFCDNSLLKFSLSASERGEIPYSVYQLEPDDAGPFGYGVPHLMSQSQSALNGAWRMMLDNGGLSTGPQIFVNKRAIIPADGQWEITPRKLWIMAEDIPTGSPTMQTFNIDGHMTELTALIELALKFMDEEAAIPIIATGEQGAHTTPTMGGMSILMNSANIIFKRGVKRFDDYITVPNLRRLYDWNMTYSGNEAIMGDLRVEARGSSVLLVTEMMAQNLLMIAEKFGAHPVFGPMIKSAQLLRSIFRANQMPADESVYTDDELKRILSAEDKGPSEEMQLKMEEMKLRQAEVAAKVEIANMEANNRLQIANIQRETALIKLAGDQNMTLDALRTQLEIKKIETDSAERKLQGEIGAQMNPRVGGSGGGGSV